MKKIIIVIVIIAFHLPGGLPDIFGKEYTLPDLYRIALVRSERIRVSEENVHISLLGKNKAKSVLLPRLSAFGSYRRFTDGFRKDTANRVDDADWGLKLDQSLSLSGREFIALDAASENVERNRYDLISLKEDYLVNLAADYYDVLKAKKALEIADANLERLTRYRDAANTRLKVGEVTKTALLRAEGELSGARSEKVKAVNSLEAAKVTLARTASIEYPYEIRDVPLKDADLPSLSELQDLALSRRTELNSLESQRKIADKELAFRKGAFWPSVSIGAVYERAEQSPATSSFHRENLFGNIALNFPLYEGGFRRADVEEAEARLRQSELLFMDAVKSVWLEVQNAYLDLITQQGIIKFLRDQLVYARDNYGAVYKQYEFGLASSLDVIDANNLLLSSEQRLADAVYNAQFFMLRLKRATGASLIDEGN